MLTHIAVYIFSFFLIWFGSGLIVRSATKFAQKLKVTPFLFSFLFLGLLTSIPEFSVGLQSVASGHSEIFVGNLLGGIMVLFTVVIPVLAVLGNGISVKNELRGRPLILTLGVILAPSLLLLDRRITNTEGLIMIGLYFGLMLFVERDHGVLDKHNKNLLNAKNYSYFDILLIILGLGLIFISSNILLSKTLLFAELLGVSAFYMSLIFVALGTDLPEFILAARSVLSNKKDIAMGDYLGAAAASTLLFGIFTLLNNGELLLINNYIFTFFYITLSLTLFYIFAHSKQFISRKEGLVLICLYFLFLVTEVITKS